MFVVQGKGSVYFGGGDKLWEFFCWSVLWHSYLEQSGYQCHWFSFP